MEIRRRPLSAVVTRGSSFVFVSCMALYIYQHTWIRDEEAHINKTNVSGMILHLSTYDIPKPVLGRTLQMNQV